MMAMNEKWTDDRVEKLVELTKSGASSAKIAFELGTTRNAVISKVSRINGLTLKHASARPANAARMKALAGPRIGPDKRRATWGKLKQSAKTGPGDVWLPPATPKPPTFYDQTPPGDAYTSLLPPKCKWAYGHSGDWRWCPNDKIIGRSYCEKHFSQSTAPYKRKVIA